MPFVKLDCGILDSTLWFDNDARNVFITALLMADPHVLREPAVTFEVNAIKETGFVVPPGWYGFIRAAGPAIIRRAGLDDKAGFAALKRLASPEAESRSPAFEGRRLVRIDGGYLALNFQKYRDKDYGAKERMRLWRQRRRETGYGVTDTGDGVTVTGVTQEEAEEEEYSLSSPSLISSSEEPLSSRKRASRRKEKFRVPTVEEVRAYLAEKEYRIDPEAFVAHYTAKGWMIGKNPMKDWRAAVVTWVKRDPKAAPHGTESDRKRIEAESARRLAESKERIKKGTVRV